MGKKTVRKRIFVSNALMVLVTLCILLMVNVVVVRVYSEFIEHELEDAMWNMTDEEDFEELIENFTIRRNEFIFLFIVDGIFCIAVLLVVSRFFTGKLVKHIMEPLDALSDGAERIRNHDLTKNVEYTGEVEFENVCRTFNEMRGAILAEQEKNRRYEKARTDMIAGISHDLRTPLTAIRGTIKGLLDGVASTPERQGKFLDTAYRRTGEMDLLLNQLFYLSKLETGNMPFDFRTIELSDFIRHYVSGKRELMEGEQMEITADIGEITGLASVDPEQLQRIFDNLLENSRKYGGVTPLKIKISLEKKNGWFYICFSDNGVGVPEEKEGQPEEIQVCDLRILVNSWKVYKGDRKIKFPNREFELLKFLAMNPNIVFSKEQLFEKIWGCDYVGDSATVMVHINRIREKIEDDSKNPKILETVWGAGYRFNK